uniref:Gypsy retrotransposon integrase-like protein 1 n=1 Tax=Xenopus tropicalis TaxID=8364 RepID=A0A803JUZ6_XENTR
MVSLGHIEEFDIARPSSWDSYAERLHFFLEANNVTDPMQRRAVLLSVIGSKTYEIVRSLVSPTKPSDCSFEEIIKQLKNHFAPTISETVKRFHFNRRSQQLDESIAAYIAELRRLAESCNFGSSLESLLRDRLVCGVRDAALQRRLLAKHNLTFALAQEEALAYEAASVHSKEIQASPSSVIAPELHQVYNKPDVKLQPALAQVSDQAKVMCHSCGGGHLRGNCRFQNAVCHKCKRRGHIQRVCRQADNLQRPKQARANLSGNATHIVKIQNDTTEKEADTGIYVSEIINSVENQPMCKKKYTDVILQGSKCRMEVDTGCDYSLISEETFHALWPTNCPPILPCDVRLVDYNKKPVDVVGACFVKVLYEKDRGKLRLIITKGQRASLLGVEWFEPLGIQLTGVNYATADSLQAVIKDFSSVFEEGLGKFKGSPISFLLDPKVVPIRMKPRPVPFALRSKIDDEIDRLVQQGALIPVTHPTWATPIVPVLKPNGEVRICADYKCTINKALQEHPYQIPAINQILSTLAKGKLFAKLDLAQAYQQLPVDDAAADAQTIITHKGAFKATRLQFGVCIAPGVFQKLMDDLLSSLPGVVPYFDDVLIGADSVESLTERVRAVLKRFSDAGLKLKKEKCVFGVPSVDFLGYKVDAHGIHPTDTKVKAIHEAPIPKNKQELQAFLGLLNFYHSFLKDKATVAEPLHRLLDKNATWKWSALHEQAFSDAKRLLSSDSVLVHYDLNKPLTLTCDASPYGIGAVLSHTVSGGREAPIAFYSRTMSTTERNYAQIDKEALAIVAGVKKFHEYLYGRGFAIITDHKPLLGLLKNNGPTAQIISPRMLRWCLLLNAYDYELQYRPGKDISNADALSRLPLNTPDFQVPALSEVLMLESLPSPPLQASDIARMTATDPVLSRVLNWVWRGWPKISLKEEFTPFEKRQHELSAYKGCLLWGNRVVIPKAGQTHVLKALHESHPGIVNMKALARSYVWWPKMDECIEKWVKSCVPCQSTRHAPAKAGVHPWEVTRSPWSRLHIDFAGPFQGQTFFLVVDSFSKWLEVVSVASATTHAVIQVLRKLFATHGLPDTIVSDNGAQFTSADFRAFMESNLIRHVTTAPFHPSSNGQAERMVQTTKDALKRIIDGDWNYRLAKFLLQQHITPSTSTGCSPAELLMNRRLKTCLDRLHPDLASDLQNKQEDQFHKNAQTSTVRMFEAGNSVYARNYAMGPKWIPAVIVEATGPVSYKVKIADGRVIRRHVDQLRSRLGDNACPNTEGNHGQSGLQSDLTPLAFPEEEIPAAEQTADVPERVPDNTEANLQGEVISVPLERPRRAIQKPRYLEDYVI